MFTFACTATLFRGLGEFPELQAIHLDRVLAFTNLVTVSFLACNEAASEIQAVILLSPGSHQDRNLHHRKISIENGMTTVLFSDYSLVDCLTERSLGNH